MLLTIIRQSFATMRTHRRWAALTMFGVVWGTASVVLLVGWGVGMHHMIDNGIQKVGKNQLFVLPGRIGESLGAAEERRVLHFDLEDVEALRARVHRADIVSAEVFEWAYARAGNRSRNIDLHGIEPNLRHLREVTVATGRFLTAEDLRMHRRVVVLGHVARERLFGARPALGQSLLLHGQTFAVVGILNRVGTQLSRNRSEVDEQLWIPITTAMTLAGRESVDLIELRIKERRFNEDAKRETRAILAERLHVSPHDEEAVFLISAIDMLATFDSVFAFLQVFLIVLAAGTLLIGGIGVMNMMLVSVAERRREIGVRLAVGAQRSHVVGQFVTETLVITLFGGVIGLSLGLLGCLLLGQLPKEMIPLPVIVPEVVALAIVITAAVGLVSGGGPAWLAARVDPAESLRSG